jgi:hypothetical protein
MRPCSIPNTFPTWSVGYPGVEGGRCEVKRYLLVLAATAAIVVTAGPAYATNTPLCHQVDATHYDLLHLSKENAYNLHYLVHPDDVIPPFTYLGQTYSLNWDAAGQALYENGCVVAQPSPSPSPSVSPTPSPSPSASPPPSTSPSASQTPSTSVAAHSSTTPPGPPNSPGVLPFTGGHVPMWMLAAIGGLLFVGTLVLRVTTRGKGKHAA